MNEIARINSPIPTFEEIKQTDEKGDFWSARKLSAILEYADYRNFKDVMERAWIACKKSGLRGLDHFGKLTAMVNIGSGAQKAVDDVRLSRYACYLIVQNSDPQKQIVALGQTYFAIQTRITEIQQMEDFSNLGTDEEKRIFLRNEIKEHNKHLASAAKGAGVIDPLDYAIFKNYGYKGLYDGLDRRGIQKKKGLPDKADILDHMGSAELASNLFVATQTEQKLKKDKIKDKGTANKTHLHIGQKVRSTIRDIGGTMPEDLPVEESIKKLEAKVKKELPKS